MRLIDADALIDALDKSAIYGWSLQEDAAARRWAERVVELMPTVEAEPEVRTQMSSADCISRQAALEWLTTEWDGMVTSVFDGIKRLPSAEPTLYGYKIEHLAYIAKVMEKEGVTADYAVRTFDDMSRALRMIIEEAQEKVMEVLNERYDLQAGGD